MSWPYPFWIAHRGAGKQAPENTLAAFHVGHAAGFRGFETDVQLSADGMPFLLHDDELERTSNGRGLASAMDWAVLAHLDAGSWHSAPYVGEPIARLQVLADFAAAQDLAINLELKPSPGEAERVGDGVARWLRAHWRAQTPPLLSSFDPVALRSAHAADGDWPLALLLEQWQDDAPEQALQLHAKAVVCQYRSMSRAAIAALHAAGLKALVYTCNEVEDAQRLIADGLDGLITDRLDLPGLLAERART